MDCRDDYLENTAIGRVLRSWTQIAARTAAATAKCAMPHSAVSLGTIIRERDDAGTFPGWPISCGTQDRTWRQTRSYDRWMRLIIPVDIDAGCLYRTTATVLDAQENSRQRRNSCSARLWRARPTRHYRTRFARRCQVPIRAIVPGGGAGNRERI